MKKYMYLLANKVTLPYIKTGSIIQIKINESKDWLSQIFTLTDKVTDVLLHATKKEISYKVFLVEFDVKDVISYTRKRTYVSEYKILNEVDLNTIKGITVTDGLLTHTNFSGKGIKYEYQNNLHICTYTNGVLSFEQSYDDLSRILKTRQIKPYEYIETTSYDNDVDKSGVCICINSNKNYESVITRKFNNNIETMDFTNNNSFNLKLKRYYKNNNIVKIESYNNKILTPTIELDINDTNGKIISFNSSKSLILIIN